MFRPTKTLGTIVFSLTRERERERKTERYKSNVTIVRMEIKTPSVPDNIGVLNFTGSDLIRREFYIHHFIPFCFTV
jgi:hypothetical protein